MSKLKQKILVNPKQKIKCPDCNGDGYVMNRIYMDHKYDEVIQCNRCGGSGYLWRSNATT